MKQALFLATFISILIGGFNSHAIEGMTSIEDKLYVKNPELSALKLQTESSSALLTAAKSAFYPTVNAVAGREQNKTDELIATEKGTVTYLEGKLNLFSGFRDVSIINQKGVELESSKLEYELKKRELRLRLTEALSQMIYVHKVQKILEEEFKLTQSQKQMAARKVAAGLTGDVDNYEFDLRENEIQIELKQINQLHNEAHEALNQIFAENVTDNDLASIDFSSFESLSKASVQTKAEDTIEFKLAELNRLRVEYERSVVKSEYMPSVDFSYMMGRITPTESSSMQFNESKYSLLLTIPLFSGFDTYYKSKSAALLLQSAEQRKLQGRLNATADINVLQSKITELGALYQLNEKRLTSAQKYFELTLTEYRRGIKNSPDLVGATERLYSSKKRKFDLLKELEVLSLRVLNLKY